MKMKTALTIAGSDCSGGAGIQADLKTMTMNGVYAMSAITALTAQNTTGVRAIQESTPDFLRQQIDAVFEDIRPDAVKIGMVASGELIRVIAEALKHHGAKNVVVDPVMVATSGSRLMQADALAALKELSTVRCFVDNFNRPHYLLKFPGQLYVQTWHGDRGFKKMMYDMDDGVKYPDYLQMDLGVSGSAFGTKNYRTAFRYGGEVMQLGMPRNDALVKPDPARIEEIRAALGIEPGVGVMLYAPTFRDATSGHAQKAGFDIERALTLLENSTGRRWICLTRAHDQNRAIEAEHADAIRDVTKYPEMSELLLTADLLITDYSSSVGDYALLNRPMIMYQPDLDAFISSDREMYFDIRTCPYVRVESEAALYSMLARFDEIPLRGEAVLKFYGATESGESAKAVAKWISDRIPE